MVQHIVTLMKKYGYCEVPPIAKKQIGVYSVICQGCGKKILTSDDCAVDYMISKRGTAMFWHPKCFDKAATKKRGD